MPYLITKATKFDIFLNILQQNLTSAYIYCSKMPKPVVISFADNCIKQILS